MSHRQPHQNVTYYNYMYIDESVNLPPAIVSFNRPASLLGHGLNSIGEDAGLGCPVLHSVLRTLVVPPRVNLDNQVHQTRTNDTYFLQVNGGVIHMQHKRLWISITRCRKHINNGMCDSTASGMEIITHWAIYRGRQGSKSATQLGVAQTWEDRAFRRLRMLSSLPNKVRMHKQLM